MFGLGELEALLREKDREVRILQSKQASVTTTQISPLSDGKQVDDLSGDFGTLPKFTGSLESSPTVIENELYGNFAGQSPGAGDDFTSYVPPDSSNGVPLMNGNSTLPNGQSIPSPVGISTSPFDSYDVGLRSWPPNLPSPEVTRHL